MITLKTILLTALVTHKTYVAVTSKSVMIDWETFFKDSIL